MSPKELKTQVQSVQETGDLPKKVKEVPTRKSIVAMIPGFIKAHFEYKDAKKKYDDLKAEAKSKFFAYCDDYVGKDNKLVLVTDDGEVFERRISTTMERDPEKLLERLQQICHDKTEARRIFNTLTKKVTVIDDEAFEKAFNEAPIAPRGGEIGKSDLAVAMNIKKTGAFYPRRAKTAEVKDAQWHEDGASEIR